MKKVVFLKREKGCVSLESMYKECSQRGHLIGLEKDPFLNGFRKYYTMPEDSDERPIEVTIASGKVISVRRVPKEVIKTLPPLVPPEFGNF